jgi:hypothetical protein
MPTPASFAAAARRAQRAGVARRLVAHAADAAAALDWDTLDQAPAWLALDDAGLAALQSRIGALRYADAVRLWIDGPRLAAARALLGAAGLDALLTQPADLSIPGGLSDLPPIASAAQVGPAWQAVGAAVLLASLPRGPLRKAATAALAPATASTMLQELAASLVTRACALDGADAADGADREAA